MNFDERVQNWLLKRMMKKDPEFWHGEGVTHRYLAHELYKASPAPAPAPLGSGPTSPPVPMAPTSAPTPAPTPNPWDTFKDDVEENDLLYHSGGDQEIGHFMSIDDATGEVIVSMHDGIQHLSWDQLTKVPYPSMVDMTTPVNPLQYFHDGKWHQGGRLSGKVVWNTADDDTDYEMKDSSGNTIPDNLWKSLFTDYNRPIDKNAGFRALDDANWKNNDSLFVAPVDADGNQMKNSKKYYAKAGTRYPGDLRKDVPQWNEEEARYESGSGMDTIPTNLLTIAPKPIHKVGDKVEGSDGRGYYSITKNKWDPVSRGYMVKANDGAEFVNESAYQNYHYSPDDINPFIHDFIDNANEDINDPSRIKTFMDTNEELSQHDSYMVFGDGNGKFDWLQQMVSASIKGEKPDISSHFPGDMMMRDDSGQLIPVNVDSIAKYGTTRQNTSLWISSAHDPDGIEMTYGEFTDPLRGGFVSAESQQHIGNLYLGTIVQHSDWGTNENGKITSIDEATGIVTVTASDGDGNETEHKYDHYNIVNGQLQVIDISGSTNDENQRLAGYSLDDLHDLQWSEIVQNPYDSATIGKGIFNIMQLEDDMSIEEAVSIFIKTNPNQFQSIVAWAQNKAGLDDYQVEHSSEEDGEYITLPDGHKSRIHFEPGSATDNSSNWLSDPGVGVMKDVGEMTWDSIAKKWVAPEEDGNVAESSSTTFGGKTMASGITDKLKELIDDYSLSDPSSGYEKYGIDEMTQLKDWIQYHGVNADARQNADSEAQNNMIGWSFNEFEDSLQLAGNMVDDWESNRETLGTETTDAVATNQ